MQEAERGALLPHVGLVGTHELWIAGLRGILEKNGSEAVELTEPHALETCGIRVVIVDAGSTAYLMTLLSTFRRMRPSLGVIVVGGPDGEGLEDGFIDQAIASGARGVLTPNASEQEMLQAVTVVAGGSVWAPQTVLNRLLGESGSGSMADEPAHLTEREIAVLKLLAQGRTNGEIALSLGVEQTTVKSHLGRLMRKAGVASRTALGVHALRERWI